MFISYPTYSPYRTLQLLYPMQHGEDVYALQTALNECGFPCGEADGILGLQTSGAIKAAQKALILTVDGKAGGYTQKALAMEIAEGVSVSLAVPIQCFKGQLELESGYRLGNYSPRRSDGSYDVGVTQRNTRYTMPEVGFDARLSIRALGHTIADHFKLFEGLKTQRRWALAQGAWNAPAFACYIAREEGAKKVSAGMVLKPSTAQRQTFEAYVANASVYLDV